MTAASVQSRHRLVGPCTRDSPLPEPQRQCTAAPPAFTGAPERTAYDRERSLLHAETRKHPRLPLHPAAASKLKPPAGAFSCSSCRSRLAPPSQSKKARACRPTKGRQPFPFSKPEASWMPNEQCSSISKHPSSQEMIDVLFISRESSQG